MLKKCQKQHLSVPADSVFVALIFFISFYFLSFVLTSICLHSGSEGDRGKKNNKHEASVSTSVSGLLIMSI